MDAADLLTKAMELPANQPAEVAPPEDAPPEGEVAPVVPDAAEPEAPPEATPEPETDINSALAGLELPPEKLAGIQKAFNDAKSKKGRELAEQNRQLKERMAALEQFEQKSAFLEEQNKRLEPLLTALQPKPEAVDPILSNPKLAALIAKGYSQDQVADLMELARAVVEPDLTALKLEKRQLEEGARRDQYIASISDGDPKHPIPWKEVEPLVAETLQGNPQINELGEQLYRNGASPEALIDFLYGQVVAQNMAKFASRFAPAPVVAPAPPAQATGKTSAAPMRSASPSAPSSAPVGNELGMAFLQASARKTT